MDPTLVTEADTLLKVWDSSSTRLFYFGYSLIGLGIFCSLAITAFTDHLKPIQIKTLGFVAALCTGLLAAFHPVDLGIAYRQAWRILHQATVEYKANSDLDHQKGIPEAIKK